jgi:hypothetical protein
VSARSWLSLLTSLVCLALPGLSAAGIPRWAEAAAATRGSVETDADAVEHLRELDVQYLRSGKQLHQRRWVLEVLTEEGREEAQVAVPYLAGASEVRELRCWRLPKGSKDADFLALEPVDFAAYEGLYSEHRVRGLVLTEHVSVGDLLLVEWLVVHESTSTQFGFSFQGELPVVQARCRLGLPKGWSSKATMFNVAEMTPEQDGDALVWELRDLGAIDPSRVLSVVGAAPRMGITVFPAEGNGRGLGPSFASWPEVSRWLAELADPRAVADAEIERRARLAVAGAETQLERIRAIGRLVQELRYVSVDTDIARGGGYRPSPAPEVLSRSYGDCKDKTALMRAMLTVVGQQSFPVACSATDPAFVNEDWPSPRQFDHSIVAVRVDDTVDEPGVVMHPTLGRLLFCDPTDPDTPIGHVPLTEQGGLALVGAPAGAELVRLPVTPASRHRAQVDGRLVFESARDIRVKFSETYEGWQAVELRSLYGSLSETELRGLLERSLSEADGTPSVVSVALDQPEHRDSLRLEYDLAVLSFAQAIGSSLLVVQPAKLGPGRRSVWDCEERETPFALVPSRRERSLSVEPPEGFVVDELPEPVTLEGPLARYELSYRQDESGTLVMNELLIWEGGFEPASSCSEFEEFRRGIDTARDGAVVFAAGG